MSLNTSISWERKLEAWAIAQVIAAGTMPPTLQLCHHDAAAPANTSRLFFEAVTGEQDPPDSPIYQTQLTIEYRSTDRDATQTDPIFEGSIAAMTNPKNTVPENAYFPGGLWYDQEASDNARNDGVDTRSRSRTYNFHVAQVP